MTKEQLWKAIEAYRSAGGREEHWARRDHLDAALDDVFEQLTTERMNCAMADAAVTALQVRVTE
jgi:hypothetical protein